jgi:hypothetical protein
MQTNARKEADGMQNFADAAPALINYSFFSFLKKGGNGTRRSDWDGSHDLGSCLDGENFR